MLVDQIGKEADETGHPPEAARQYWTTWNMGARMQAQGLSTIEKLIGGALQDIAYQRLHPLLEKAGRSDEALSLTYAHELTRQRVDTFRPKDPLAHSSNYLWAALLIHISLSLVIGFGALTVLTITYVNLKRWVRPNKKGRLYQVMTVAESYLPIALFLSCSGLYISFYPYARNFEYYMTTSGPIHNLEPLFVNAFPSLVALPNWAYLPLGNPFRPYVWYALIGLALVVLLEIAFRRRAPAVDHGHP